MNRSEIFRGIPSWVWHTWWPQSCFSPRRFVEVCREMVSQPLWVGMRVVVGLDDLEGTAESLFSLHTDLWHSASLFDCGQRRLAQASSVHKSWGLPKARCHVSSAALSSLTVVKRRFAQASSVHKFWNLQKTLLFTDVFTDFDGQGHSKFGGAWNNQTRYAKDAKPTTQSVAKDRRLWTRHSTSAASQIQCHTVSSHRKQYKTLYFLQLSASHNTTS